MKLSVIEVIRKIEKSRWTSRGMESTKVRITDDTLMHAYISSGITSPKEGQERERAVAVLLHGFGADSLSGWGTPQIKALSKRFHLVVPDLVFFGKSTTTSAERSEIFQADCVKQLLDHFGIVRNVMVVGHSYGGMVTFWLAQRYPELVRRVVFVSSGICFTAQDNVRIMEEVGVSDMTQVLVPPDLKTFTRSMSMVQHNGPSLPRFIWKDLFKSMGGKKGELRMHRCELIRGMIMGTDRAQPLPKLEQDGVFLIWGEHDQIFPLEQAYRIHSHFEGKSHLVVLNGCGHVPHMEKPDELTETLLRFLGA